MASGARVARAFLLTPTPGLAGTTGQPRHSIDCRFAKESGLLKVHKVGVQALGTVRPRTLAGVRGGREAELVELVDPSGRPIGESTVREAHRAPGRLHRAFSVLLIDAAGRLLLQQRAAVKTRFPLHWANACCGHPGPDEPVVTAATRRLAEEIGLRDVPLAEIGVYAYRAPDPTTGQVEHEYDHVLLGRVPPDVVPYPDPAEVAALRWILPGQLMAEMGTGIHPYAPWLGGVLGALPDWPTR